MCNHCLSLDLCLIRCDSLFCCCLKIKKERIIVSWTIKGSDTCFRLLWGRTITELRINNTASNTWPQTHTSPTTSSAANIYCSHLSALPVMTSSSVFLAALTLGGVWLSSYWLFSRLFSPGRRWMLFLRALSWGHCFYMAYTHFYRTVNSETCHSLAAVCEKCVFILQNSFHPRRGIFFTRL